MSTLERSLDELVCQLPPREQEEVRDFVEFLLTRARPDDASWSRLSLDRAVRGLEAEEWPEYTDSDFTERWR